MLLTKNFLRKNLVVIFLLGLVGCTYTGSLDKDFYSLPDNVETGKKLDIKVGLVNSSTIRDLRFRASNAGHGVDIEIGDSVITSMAKELSSIFKLVKIIERPSNDLSIDLYALPSVKWEETGRDAMNANIHYEIETKIIFKDKKSGASIAEFIDSHQAHYSPPATGRALKYLEAASLFLLAPITSPLATQSIGRKAEEMLREHIVKSVRNIGDQINDDIKIRNYAEFGGRPDGFKNTKIAKATETPTPKTPTPAPPQSGTGSGFFVSKLGHVITNAHVVKGCNMLTVGDSANKQVPAEVINTDSSNDLALLKLSSLEMASAESKSLIQKLGIAVVPLASSGLLRSEDVRLGERVLVAGYPFGDFFSNSIKVTTGVVSATRGAGDDSGQFQLDAAIQPGSSGGPIYDSGGNIVGVVISQLDKLKVAKAIGSIPENVNFGVKASTVKQFLISSGLPSKKAEQTDDKSTEQLAEIAQNQALMVMCIQ